VVTEEVAGQNHLAQTEARTKGGEEADGRNGKGIDEDDGQGGVDEAELEDGLGEGANGKGRHDHVGREPLICLISLRRAFFVTLVTLQIPSDSHLLLTYHRADFGHGGVSALVLGDALNTALLDTELASKSLALGVPGVADGEVGLVDDILVAGVADSYVGITADVLFGGVVRVSLLVHDGD
jgi:hypothetical protein